MGNWFSDFLFGSEGTPSQATWLQKPQYRNVAPAMESAWDYVSKGLESIQAGKPPTWFQQWRPLEETQRRNALYGTYYGGGGQAGVLGQGFGPGILEGQRAADIKAGRRGAGAGSNYARQLDQYAKASNELSNYMSQLGAQAMESSEGRYINAMSQGGLNQGPEGEWWKQEGTEGSPGFLSSLAGMIPYAIGAATGVPIPPMSTGGGGFGGWTGARAGTGSKWLTGDYTVQQNQSPWAYNDYYNQQNPSIWNSAQPKYASTAYGTLDFNSPYGRR